MSRPPGARRLKSPPPGVVVVTTHSRQEEGAVHGNVLATRVWATDAG